AAGRVDQHLAGEGRDVDGADVGVVVRLGGVAEDAEMAARLAAGQRRGGQGEGHEGGAMLEWHGLSPNSVPSTLTLPRKGGGDQTAVTFWSPPPLRGRVRVGGSMTHPRGIRSLGSDRGVSAAGGAGGGDDGIA